MWYYTVGGHNWFFVCINSIIYLQSHTHTHTQSGHSGKDRKKRGKHTHTHTLRHDDDGDVAPTAQPNSESAFHSE